MPSFNPASVAPVKGYFLHECFDSVPRPADTRRALIHLGKEAHAPGRLTIVAPCQLLGMVSVVHVTPVTPAS